MGMSRRIASSDAVPASQGAASPHTAPAWWIGALMQAIQAPRQRTMHAPKQLARSPRLGLRALWSVWGVTRLILLLIVLFAHSYCDPWFYHYAGQFAVGQWPYRSVPVEYPPLAIVLILLPALPLLPFAGIAPRPDSAFNLPIMHLPHPDPVRYGAYGVTFAIEMLLIDALTLWLVQRAARKLTHGNGAGIWAGLLYIALTFATGAILQKFDLAVGTLLLAAVVALVRRRRALAWSLLALAALIKGFPLLVAPIFMLYELELSGAVSPIQAIRMRWRAILSGFSWFAATIGVWSLLVFFGAGWRPIAHTLLYHSNRGTEIESVYANLWLALGWLPGLAVRTTFNGLDLSRVVLSPLDRYSDTLSTLLLIASLLACYALALWAALRRMRSAASGVSGTVVPVPPVLQAASGPTLQSSERQSFKGATGPRRAPTLQCQEWTTHQRVQALVIGTALVTLAFTLTFRALPAHYLLDVAPLAILVQPLGWQSRRLRACWLGCVFAVALIGQIITVIWPSLVALQPWAVGVLTLRNLAWLAAFGTLGVMLWGQWRAPDARFSAEHANNANGHASVGETKENEGMGAETRTKSAPIGLVEAAPLEPQTPVVVDAPVAPDTQDAAPLPQAAGSPRNRIAGRWHALLDAAPSIPGFTPRGEDVFPHLLQKVEPERLTLAAGVLSTLIYLGFVLAFPIFTLWDKPHVTPNSSLINDMGAITGYSPWAALGFVWAVLTLFACQFLALVAAGRVRLLTPGRVRLMRLMALGFPAIFALVMLWMQPVTTTDLYGYVARGYLYAQLHQNPMVDPAYQLPGGLSVDRPAAPYGPLWLLITWVVAKLSGENLLMSMLLFKGIAAVAMLASLFLLDQLAKRFFPESRLQLDVLIGWSPLLLFEAIGNGHNDIVMMLCVLLAFTCMMRGRAQAAFAFLVLGALVKYIAAFIVPLWLVYELRHRLRPDVSHKLKLAARGAPLPAEASQMVETSASPGGALAGRALSVAQTTLRQAGEVDRGPAIRLLAGATLIGGILTALCYAPFWDGLQTFTGLGQQLRPLYYNSSIASFISGPLQLFVPTGQYTALDKTVRLIFYTLFVCYAAVQTHRLWALGPRADLHDLFTASAKITFAALLLITFWFQPWYVVWLLPLAALSREPFVRRQGTILSVGALLTYAVSAYVLVNEPGLGRDFFVQLFEILLTFAPLLLLRAAPYEQGWISIARRYTGLVGEWLNRSPIALERAMLALILIVAALLRLLKLGDVASASSSGASEVSILKAVSGDLRLFITDPQGLNGPFEAIQSFLIRVFGPSPFVVLLPSAILGTVTVFVIYLLTAEIGRQGGLPGARSIGVLAALLAATSRWHVSLSRSGMEVVLLPLLLCTAIYWLLLAFRISAEPDPTRANQILRGAGRLSPNSWKVLALTAGCGVCTGLACDLAPGLWLLPLLVLGFVIAWRWRSPHSFERLQLGLATLAGAAILSAVPIIWSFLSQLVGFPAGSYVLAHSSKPIPSGPGVFTLAFWSQVGANLVSSLNLIVSQDFSAGYPAVGGAPIIPTLLGPFLALGLLVLIWRWRSMAALAVTLLIALPLVASVAVGAPVAVIEAASALPVLCILPALGIYQIALWLGRLPIALDRISGVRVFTTPEQIGRLALFVFLLASAIRTFFWYFESTLPNIPANQFTPSFIGEQLARLPLALPLAQAALQVLLTAPHLL
ncbi:MAG: glycosyltransferase 87 family protein [Ktedonobacterales bacterium]